MDRPHRKARLYPVRGQGEPRQTTGRERHTRKNGKNNLIGAKHNYVCREVGIRIRTVWNTVKYYESFFNKFKLFFNSQFTCLPNIISEHDNATKLYSVK